MARTKPLGIRGISIAAEDEIRSVLKDPNMTPADALDCIDEIVARYTGCGNTRPAPRDYQRLADTYPRYFDWDNRS